MKTKINGYVIKLNDYYYKEHGLTYANKSIDATIINDLCETKRIANILKKYYKEGLVKILKIEITTEITDIEGEE